MTELTPHAPVDVIGTDLRARRMRRETIRAGLAGFGRWLKGRG